MLVNYSKIPWHEFESHPRELDTISWDVADTKLLINSEGCGYPPRVNCTEFARKYGYKIQFIEFSKKIYIHFNL